MLATKLPAPSDAVGRHRSTSLAQGLFGDIILLVAYWKAWKVELPIPHDTPPHLITPSPTFAHTSLQCRSCPRCELARRAGQFAGRDPGLRSDRRATSGRRLDRRRRGAKRSLRLGASSLPAVFRRQRRWPLTHEPGAAIPQLLARSNPWSSAVACPAAASPHTIRYAHLRPRARQLTQFVKRSSALVALVSSCGVEAVKPVNAERIATRYDRLARNYLALSICSQRGTVDLMSLDPTAFLSGSAVRFHNRIGSPSQRFYVCGVCLSARVYRV
jgi:hypothetical protein